MSSLERTYQLLIDLAAPQRLQIGKLGEFNFPAGRYVYTGSARHHLQARIARHLSASKTLRWHIDFLLAAQTAQVFKILRFKEAECEVNRRTLGQLLIPSFGASDCRAGCISHLKYLGKGELEAIRLTPARPEEAQAIAAMGWDIWQRCYFPAVLTQDAIAYLWQRNLSPATICKEIAQGVVYEWIEANTRVGFLAWHHLPEAKRLRLNKLYLLPEYHRRGIGTLALSHVKQLAVQLGVKEIYLYVFKKNQTAIRAYLKAGFVITAEEVTDAGSGYCYDDYVMTCDLSL